jgi:hypothetical protein
LTREVYPKVSAEQEALHDVAAGIKNYKEYIAYAQEAAAILKVAPNNTRVKEALEKTLGNLDSISKKLESAASTLGKIGKYANLASDAIGIARSMNDLVKKIPGDFSDRKAVGEFADALKDTSDNAQAWFDRGRDALLAAGKSSAGVAFSYITGIVSVGADGLQAGVKNVNAYIDRTKNVIKQIEHGGNMPKQLEPPPPPPPHKTYKELQLQEYNEKKNIVSQTVDSQFENARDGVKKAFQARHQEVHDQFDKEVVPKIYLQNRNAMIQRLEREVHELGNGPKYNSQLKDTVQLLEKMKQRSGSRLTPDQIQDEIGNLRAHFGYHDEKGVQRLSLEELLPQYRPELDKFYEKHGFGEGALQREYAQHGLTSDAQRTLQKELLHNLGLDQLPF